MPPAPPFRRRIRPLAALACAWVAAAALGAGADRAEAIAPGVASTSHTAATAISDPAGGSTITNVHGVAVDADGNVYASSTTSSRTITKISPSGTELGTFAPGTACTTTNGQYSGVAVYDGRLYQADTCTGKVHRYTASSPGTDSAAAPTETSTGTIPFPYDMAVNVNGVYVTDHQDGSGGLFKLVHDLSSQAEVSTSPNATAYDQGGGVDVDAAGNVYVGDVRNFGIGDRVVKLDKDGTYLSTVTTAVAFPFGLAVDRAGGVWAVENDTTLEHFDASGTSSGTFTVSGNARFLELGPDGTLYVANYTAGVARLAVAQLTATEGATTTIDSKLTVGDVDSADLTKARVTVASGGSTAEDKVEIATPGTLTITQVSNTQVELSGTASKATYQAALRTAVHKLTGDNPGSTTRTLTVEVYDGTDWSNAYARKLAVTPVNDAPTVTTSSGSTAFTEDGGAVAVDTGLTVSDPDSSGLASATVSISSGYQSSEDSLSFTNDGSTMGNVAASWSNGTLTLTSSGATATPAQWQAALRAVKYANSSQNPNTTNRTISFTVNDGSATSSTVSKTVTVTAVNDAPSAGGDVTVKNPANDDDAAVAEDSRPATANVSLRPATLSDADGTTPTKVRILSVTGGHLRQGDGTSLTVGSSGTALTLGGSPSRVDLRFTPDANRTTNASFAYAIVDPDDASTNSSSSTATVPIQAVDDAPVVWPGGTRSLAATLGATGTLGGQLSNPNGVAVDGAGNVYLAESGANRVMVFGSDGSFLRAWGWDVVSGGDTGFEVCTVAADCKAGTTGSGDGQFHFPVGIAVDADGQVYVADALNHRIQKFTASSGAFVAKWGGGGSGAGQLSSPENLALDAVSNVYVADTVNDRVVKFDRHGDHLLTWGRGVADGTATLQTCTTTCQAGSVGTGDGELDDPTGIAVGPAGQVYVAERTGDRIQEFSAAGAFVRSFGNSGGNALQQPFGVATDGVGNVYVTDQVLKAVHKYSATGTFVLSWDGSATPAGQLATAAGVTTTPAGDVYVSDYASHRVHRFGPAALASTENAAATTIDPSAEVADVDSTNLTGGTVSVASGYAQGDDVLSYTAPGGNPVTGSFDATTGALTLSGAATVAQYQDALRAVAYRNASETPAASRTVSFTAGSSAAALRSVTVTAVNDVPSAGGDVTAVKPDGTALKVPKNASATDIRLQPTTLSDADGTTPTKIRIASVTGGTLTDSGGLAITTGASGTKLLLSGDTLGVNLEFQPTAGSAADGSISYTVVDPNDETVNSSASTATVDVYDVPSGGTATVSGPYAAGQTLTANVSGVTGDGTITYAYQWQRCDADGANCANVGTNSASHTTSAAPGGDVGKTFKVTVTASNEAGAGTPFSSAVTAVRQPGANGEIAYRDVGDSTWDLRSIRPDGTGARTILAGAGSNAGRPAWSPDGTQLTYDSSQALRRVAAEGTGDTDLSEAGYDAAVSPDGTKVAVSRNTSGNIDVWVLQDGVADRRVTSNAAMDDQPTWSPDGTKLAFRSFRGGATADVWTIDATTTDEASAPTRVTGTGGDSHPDWSPDGSKLLFASDRNGAGNGDLFTTPAGNAYGGSGDDGATALASANTTNNEQMPAWSPDGTKIVYVGFSSGGYALFTAPSDGSGSATQLTTGGDLHYVPQWQPALAPTAGTVSISGTLRFGETLTASSSGTTGSPLLSKSYVWQRCTSAETSSCAAISGATASTYTLTADDVGKRIRAVKTFTNGAGSDTGASTVSDEVGTVAADLEVTKTDGATSMTTGGTVTWTVEVANQSTTQALDGATFVDDVDDTKVSSVSWTCTAATGSTCGTASGTGDVSTAITKIAASGKVTFTISGTAKVGATGTLSNTATATLPGGYSDADGGLSATDTTTLNNRPVLTATGTALAYTEDDAATAVDAGLTVTDAEDPNLASATVQITGNHAAGEDVLDFTDQAGITKTSWNATTGTLALTGATTVANWQTALRAVTYRNTSQNPSTSQRTVTFSVSDGKVSGTATRGIAVTAVNDAPVGVADAISTDEDTTKSVTAAGVLGNDTDPENDTLSVGRVAEAAGNVGAAQTTGKGAKATIAADGAVTYDPDGRFEGLDAGESDTDSITYRPSDGSLVSTSAATVTFTVTGVNDAPAPVADTGTVGEDATLTRTAATGVLANDTDPDAETLSVTKVAGSATDVGRQITTGKGALLTLNADGSFTYETNGAFEDLDDGESTTDATAFHVGDGTAETASSLTITITGANDAPVVALSSSADLAYTENDPPLTFDGSLGLTDVDDAELAGATVRITDGRGTGDVLAFTAGSTGVTGSFDADTGTLTLSGTRPVADYRTALRTVTYANTHDNPSSADRTIEVAVTDGTATSTARSRKVAFTGVNDAPVVISTGTALAYTDGDGAVALDGGVEVTDADSTSLSGATVTVTSGYRAGADLLAFDDANGITGSWDESTGRLTLSGTATLAAYRDALRSITYRFIAPGGTPAERTVTLVVTDAGGEKGDGATRTVRIALVPPARRSAPFLNGSPRQGQTLSADPGSWAGSTPQTYAYRWQRCDAGGSCADIPGATGQSRTAEAADVGHRLRVVVRATNDAPKGSAESASAATAPVRGPLAAPTISERPAARSSDTAPRFTFSGESDATFQCSLDGSQFTACSSPLTLPRLADGAHTFSVRQVHDGVTSEAASATWTVDTTPPPAPVVTVVDGLVQVSLPGGETLDGGSFECRVDGGAWQPCTPGWRPVGLEAGPHLLEIRYVDAAGNPGAITEDAWVVSREQADADLLTPGVGVLAGGNRQSNGNGSGSGTVGLVGRTLVVGCGIRASDLKACTVEVFTDGSTARSAATKRRKGKRVGKQVKVGLRVGRGRVSVDERGVRQRPVDVELNATGRRLLRENPSGVKLRFEFTITSHDSDAKPVEVTQRARVVLVRRFIVAARRGFAGDSARLDAPARRYLRQMVAALRGQVRTVRCEGHADSSGGRRYAKQIGLRRARAVCRYLQQRGLRARMQVVSRGSTRPRASNRTPSGRARNRRVEVVVR